MRKPTVNSEGLIVKCCTLLLLFFSIHISAQKVTVTADRDKILLGEQINVQLKVEDVNPRISSLSNWFLFSDTASHIEIVRKDNIDTAEVNGLATYIQNVVVTSFDSGRWQLPFTQITLQYNDSLKPTVLRANEVDIDVLPVDVNNLKEYHPIKDIIEVKSKNYTWLYILIGVAIAVILFFLIRYFVKKPKKVVVAKPVSNVSNFDWAMQQLQQLEKAGAASDADKKQFYTTLDFIYREYFRRQLAINSLHVTAGELMFRLNAFLQKEENRTAFYQVIRLANAVKFAKYIPADTQPATDITVVKTTIEFIDHFTKKLSPANAK